MYEIHWSGLYVTQWLERLLEPEKTEAIAYIVGLHKELDNDLISDLEDSEGNSLLGYIQPGMADRQIAELLLGAGVGDFSIGQQKLLFASIELAEAMSFKIKKIYQYLDLFTEVLGRDYLNLQAIDPRISKKEVDYTCEMEELLAEYWSLFPRESHKLFK